MNDTPTPETLFKLRLDPVLSLRKAGHITDIDVEALKEIEQAWNWITHPVRLRVPQLHEMWTAASGFSDDQGEDPACVKRYRFWQREMKRRRQDVERIIRLVCDGVACAPRHVVIAVQLFPLSVSARRLR